MTSRTDISAKQPAAHPLSEDVIQAIGEALRAELDAGRSVRIRRLGMWTPYISDDGTQTVVFHSEMNLNTRTPKGQQKEMHMNTTDIDIPFVDDTVQAHKARPAKNAPLIDVQLLFDEVREEFGLVDLPAGKSEPVAPQIDFQADLPETAPETSAAPESAQELVQEETQEPAPLPDPFEEFEAAPPAPLKIDELQESEEVFRMNRERLFHPPEPQKSNGMRIAAMIMTGLMIAMIGYMLYSSGILNGMLPDNLKYRPTPLERRVPGQVPPSAQ